jgi:hypothetical protein
MHLAAALVLALFALETGSSRAQAQPQTQPQAQQAVLAAPAASAPSTSVTVQGRRDNEAEERRHSVVGLTVIGS